MGGLLDQLRAGAPSYTVEETSAGLTLICQISHELEFSQLVRDLLNRNGSEFVVLPVTDGHQGYERAILVPM